MKVVMRAATSRASMPDFFSAQAVSAMPPAPPDANRRVAAWPARVISVLARNPIRELSPSASIETARNRIAWPTKDMTSRPSASVSQPRCPVASFDQTSGRSASAGAITTRPATITALATTSTTICRGEIAPERDARQDRWLRP